MTSFLRSDRSTPVALWLFAVAALVVAMVLVGGATRLTGSGLSITEWRPVTGAIPPLSDAAWQAEFARYKTIPQYRELNQGMGLAGFRAIYWWEWTHRLLGRLVGVVFAVPFVIFLVRRQIPKRLVWRCCFSFCCSGRRWTPGRASRGRRASPAGARARWSSSPPPSPRACSARWWRGPTRASSTTTFRSWAGG